MANNALAANGNTVDGYTSDITLTTKGSDWYWTVTAVMAFSTIIFIALAHMKPRSDRVFHYITASITMIAAIAYFTMASSLGWASIGVEYHRSNPKVHGNTREIFYVRYIDWVFTTPLLLLDLLLTAGVPWPTILYTLLLDEIMIITGLVGALVASSYKWGYFAFGCAALVAVAWNVTWTARKYAAALGADVSRVFIICGVWTIFLWFLYPIAWGLAEGGNVISADAEGVFYGILDILAKPVFGALLLFGHRNIAPARLGLYTRDYDAVPTNNGLVHEKHHHNGLTGNGATTATENTTATSAV